MHFSHPLARQARIWSTAGVSGVAQPILVIVTTLMLDPEHKTFNAKKTEQLHSAAKEWISANGSIAVDYMLINRAKEW